MNYMYFVLFNIDKKPVEYRQTMQFPRVPAAVHHGMSANMYSLSLFPVDEQTEN